MNIIVQTEVYSIVLKFETLKFFSQNYILLLVHETMIVILGILVLSGY